MVDRSCKKHWWKLEAQDNGHESSAQSTSLKHETMTLWRTIAKYPRIIRFEKYCLITSQNTAARTEDLVKKYQGNHIYCIFRMHFKQKSNSAPQLHQNIYLREGQPKIFINKVSAVCAFQGSELNTTSCQLCALTYLN